MPSLAPMHQWTLLVVAVSVSACFDPVVPPSVFVGCVVGEECPTGLVCLLGDDARCIGPDAPCVVYADREAAVMADGTPCGDGHVCVDATCVAARCGDGVISGVETCDGEPDCRADCTRCGDDVVDAAEGCDDGDRNSDVEADACRSTCVRSQCGDGVADTGEACDDGVANSDGRAGACRTGCTLPRCGDRILDGGEVCDDGNDVDGDGCRGDCLKQERCGDRLLDPAEACDDGNANPIDGCDACQAQTWQREVVIGQAARAGPRTRMSTLALLTIDPLGRIWVPANNTPGVFRLDPDGTMSLVAGIRGRIGRSGDGGPALLATFGQPSGAALDPLGRVLIADQTFGTLRRVDGAGNIQTIATAGIRGVYVSADGVILLTDPNGGRILRLAADDRLVLVASGLARPVALVTDAAGAIYVAEEAGHRVTRIDPSGTFARVAGTGTAAFFGDQGPATAAALNAPAGLALAADGSLYVADTGNHRVRRVALDGTITTVAGNGTGTFAGDGGPAVDAALNRPIGIVFDARGDLIIADSSNNLLRRVGVDGRIASIAGLLGDADEPCLSRVADPGGFAFDGSGVVLIADQNFHRVRRFDLAAGGPTAATTFVGDAPNGFGGDGGDARSARLAGPTDVALDDDGRLVIADSGNRRIRIVDVTGIIDTAIGDGSAGPLVDGAQATQSPASPRAVAIGPSGEICFADVTNHAVACVDPADGVLRVVAGGRGIGNSGDGGPARLAQLNTPNDLAFDGVDGILIADTGNHVIRRIDRATGTITRVVGTGVAGKGDGPALTASLSRPVALDVAPDGRVCIADAGNRRTCCVAPGDELVVTVAGTGAAGVAGDGGPAVEARIGEVLGLGFDPEGRLHFTSGVSGSESDNRLRRIDADGTITTVVGQVHPAGNGPADLARLYGPAALAFLGADQLVSVGAFDRLQRWDRITNEVDVVVGYDSAAPVVQGLAGFSPLLQRASGLAFDPAAGLLFITEETSRTLRVIGLDPDGAGGIAPPSTWTNVSVPTTMTGPGGIALDPGRNELIVADVLAHCVRRVSRSGEVLGTLLGSCGIPGVLPGFLNRPSHVAVSPITGAVYIADTGNNRVLRVDDVGVAVVLGDGSVSSAGEGSPADLFPVNAPRQLALDEFGNLYVSSTTSIRQVANVDGDDDADGDDRVSTIFGGGDRDEAPESDTFCLNALALGPDGAVYAGDACQGFLVRVAPETAP